jgi:transposase
MKDEVAREKKIVVRMGIDIAKSVFQFHGVNKFEETVLRRQVPRRQVLVIMSAMKPCLIGMEACGSAHYWARELEKLGHTCRLLPGHLVKPYRKNAKNDANDAAAICEAVGRPTMRFVPVKNLVQHEIQSIHRVRQEIVKMRTMQVNQIRGLLAEFGVVMNTGVSRLRKEIPLILEDGDSQLTSVMRTLVSTLYEFFCVLDDRLEAITKQIEEVAKNNPLCRKMMKIGGVGPMSASALHAAIGNGSQFHRGRDVSAWLGIVPRQNSTGGKTVLGRISKKGNRYIRTLFVHGARSVVQCAHKKETRLSKWINGLVQKKGKNRAAVALANKNVRVAWALMQSDAEYRLAA